MIKSHLTSSFLVAAGLLVPAFAAPLPLELAPDARVVFMGNGLASRMTHYGHVETELQLRHPAHRLIIRNMADEGNTPSFRPHSGRDSQLGFPGAEAFAGPYCDGNLSSGKGHFETEEEWLTRLQPDVLVAFFGFNASFQGMEGLGNFRAELDAFVTHTKAQAYNGKTPPKLVLVSPIAYEDRTADLDVPNGVEENKRLAAYAAVMEAVAHQHGIGYIDLFTASRAWYEASKEPLTNDGALLNSAGYTMLAHTFADALTGPVGKLQAHYRDAVHEAVMDKNWLWINDFKIPNGVHVFGRRYNPFGPKNYPFEIEKIRAMTTVRDQAIHAALQGKAIDITALDTQTPELPAVPTNYKPGGKNGGLEFLKGDEALATLEVPEGYQVELFASEQEFPDLANPVQLAFDNQGRLWVATMPSYPHWRPGNPRPDDKLIILEDTNGDGKADKQTTWADGLDLPMGFELSHDGVFVAQGISLVHLRDTNGDDKADSREVLYSGFDDHDTHHAIGAFVADPSGAIIMNEGTFLRTSVETPYGTVRGTNGGFYRYAPQRRHLERHAQLSIPNPWGVAFDDWGQHFFLHTSGPSVEWMMPGTVKPMYGRANPKSQSIIEKAHRVRPTSGVEILHSRHFPEEVQGDMILCNAIGFLGIKQHDLQESGTGFTTKWRHDLLKSSDGNFRPVDLEVAPDGSLYVVDWHNPLIGHMQHNARDPHRDHAHGRIYRITYPGRPLVQPAKVAGASIGVLLDNLKLPEYRTRYRSRRELRGHDADEVAKAVVRWVSSLDKTDPAYLHHMTEALWVTWGANKVNERILRFLLASDDHRARAAAVRVLRYTGHQIPEQVALLKQAAKDPHNRVRLEAVTAASWLNKEDGLAVLEVANQLPAGLDTAQPGAMVADNWTKGPYETALAHLNNQNVVEADPEVVVPSHLNWKDAALFKTGAEIYEREGHCITCHQPDGNGLPSAGFPPVAGSRWVTEQPDRLIKLTLNGLMGPIVVKGVEYPGLVPMTPFGGMLNDDEIAAVLTYVRNSFGNKAAPIRPEDVKKVRAATQDKVGFYTPEELLKAHPHP